mmetsp:Transcript_57654/g.135698  ORF Transcript_57654/g.135698 Transcript_57654/m.135698 type:complete len:258 (-) Transcript_57654:231-1004(-)
MTIEQAQAQRRLRPAGQQQALRRRLQPELGVDRPRRHAVRVIAPPAHKARMASQHIVVLQGQQMQLAARAHPGLQCEEGRRVGEWPVREVGIPGMQLPHALRCRPGQGLDQQPLELGTTAERLIVHGLSGWTQPSSVHWSSSSRAPGDSRATSGAVSIRRSARRCINAASRPPARKLSPFRNTWAASYSIRLRRSRLAPRPGSSGSPGSNQTLALGSVRASPSARSSACGAWAAASTARRAKSSSATGTRPGSDVAS